MEELEEKKQSMMKYAATYGLIVGLGLILLSTLDYVFKQYGQNNILTFLNYVVMIGGVVYFTIMYRSRALGGYITYGQSLGFGIVLIIFASIVSGVFNFALNMIDPSYMAKQMEMAADSLVQLGYSEDLIEQSMRMTKVLNNPIFVLFSSVLGGALIGTIISLITSIFTKREKSIF